MSLLVDAVTNAFSDAATSLTWSHTCTGADRGLTVNPANFPAVAMSATYAGVAMLSEGAQLDAASESEVEQFTLIAPATGQNNIALVWGGSAINITVGALSVTGVHQTDMARAQVKASGNSGTASVAAPSAVGELVIDVVSGWHDTNSWVVGAGQTQRWNVDGANGWDGAGSTEPGAASVTMSWTSTLANSWAIAALSLIPAAAADAVVAALTKPFHPGKSPGKSGTPISGRFYKSPMSTAASTFVLSAVIGQALEADTAQPVSWAPKRRLVGQATETDLAQAIVRSKLRALGQAIETDTAGAVAGRKTRAVGQAVETDIAQALTKAKRKALGQATETDLSQAITARKTRAIGQASEADSAQPVTATGNKIIAVGQAVETDTAQALARIKRRAIAQVAEMDTAQLVAPLKRRLIGQAVETDAALGIARVKRFLLGQAIEIDLALAITRGGVFVTITPSATLNTVSVTVRETHAAVTSHTNRAQVTNRFNLVRFNKHV